MTIWTLKCLIRIVNAVHSDAYAASAIKHEFRLTLICGVYATVLRKRQMIPSMSRPWNPGDSESADPRVLGVRLPSRHHFQIGLMSGMGRVSGLYHDVSAEATDILWI